MTSTTTTTTFCSQLGLMVDKPECSDLEFLVGPDLTPVYASRLILVARSPVFAAQFMGGFKEALTPPSSLSPSSSASSSSPPGTSDTTSSLSQPFWRAKLLEVEPAVFRRLLHCCYTDHLPPDDAYPPVDGSSGDGSTRARDLVSLYAAADRFLLDHCKQLVCDQLDKVIDCSNVLAAFDHALAVAPDLTKRDGVLLPIICSNASQLLGNADEVAEAQWLAMSTAGAAAVVACNLSGLREVDLFRAVERWYRHLLEQDEDEEGQHVEQSEANEERLARVLEGMQYLLMNADELHNVVEKSGLLSSEKLLVAYRECALYRRMALPGLPEPMSSVQLFGRVTIRDGQMAWSAQLTMRGRLYTMYIVSIHNHPQGKTSSTASSGRVSYAGISMRLYLDRECHVRTFKGEDACLVSRYLGRIVSTPPQSTPRRVVVLVHVPDFAMGPAPT